MQNLVRLWGVVENGESMELALRPHLVSELVRRWPPIGFQMHESSTGTVAQSRGLSNDWIIFPDRGESGDAPSQMAWDQLEQSMTAFAVLRLTRLVAVHAATIAWNNRVLLVPAASGSGKSTLSLAAHHAGAKVLSDEYTLIDPANGLVTGWSRAVEILEDDGDSSRCDITVKSEPLPVGLIAVVAHRAGARNEWSSITAGEAVGELLNHCVTARVRPAESMDAALTVARSTPAVRGTRGEAKEAILGLLDLLD